MYPSLPLIIAVASYLELVSSIDGQFSKLFQKFTIYKNQEIISPIIESSPLVVKYSFI